MQRLARRRRYIRPCGWIAGQPHIPHAHTTEPEHIHTHPHTPTEGVCGPCAKCASIHTPPPGISGRLAAAFGL